MRSDKYQKKVSKKLENTREKLIFGFKRLWKKYQLTKFILLISLTVVLVTSSYLFYLAKTTNVSALQASLENNTMIYDENDQEAGLLYGQKGTYVKLSEISPYVQEAVVVTEDRSFYQNHGIDLLGIGRAIAGKLTFGLIGGGGGSTITQQLAKNAYLTLDETMTRKAREIFLALEINKKYTKDEILAMYLNQAYFGNGVWGVEDASQRYFGVSAKDLTLGEAATIVGMLKGPEIYNPVSYPDNANNRRDTVLQNLVVQKKITEEEAKQESSIRIETLVNNNYQGKTTNGYQYPSYFDAVINEAISTYGLSEKEILNNGYKIYTTLDQNYQAGMQETYQNLALFPQAEDGQYAQSATVAINPATGGVEALVGNVETDGAHTFRGFNYATQAKRSPGSTIKPLVVYTPAVEAGWSINKMLEDTPHDYNGYAPNNYGNTYSGEVPMYQALARSLNLPAVWTVDKLGINRAYQSGLDFGLHLTQENKKLGLALGSGVLTNPWEMAQAYATFANNGVEVEAHLIRKIVDGTGAVIAENKTSKKRVIDQSVADKMTSMMLGTYTNGTGVYAAPYGFTLAGKTGTTETDFNSDLADDQWVIGYTKDVVMTTWLGFEKTDETHYLNGISAQEASAIFKDQASRILPFTKKTAFKVDNAYYQAGINSDVAQDPNGEEASIASDYEKKAKSLLDEAKERLKDTEGLKQRASNLLDKIKDFFKR
ncbi:MAG: PBP1A family penicillin-binding protein [Streptococcaceae bacterium]|jgi:penicillin-binding protein 2A|nr:PBP1A family penicillin-binding protein [Streptococcaceae bacterium]